MPNGFSPFRDCRKNQTRACKIIQVSLGNKSSSIVKSIQMTKLHPENCSLQFVQATVVSSHHIDVFRPGAVVTKHSDPARELLVVRGNGAPIPKCPQILSGIKTPSDHVAMCSDALALIARSMCLSSILQNLKAVTMR